MIHKTQRSWTNKPATANDLSATQTSTTHANQNVSDDRNRGGLSDVKPNVR